MTDPDKKVVEVLWKDEGSEEDGRRFGPCWAKLADGRTAPRYVGADGLQKWVMEADARADAKAMGAPFREV